MLRNQDTPIVDVDDYKLANSYDHVYRDMTNQTDTSKPGTIKTKTICVGG